MEKKREAEDRDRVECDGFLTGEHSTLPLSLYHAGESITLGRHFEKYRVNDAVDRKYHRIQSLTG